MINLNKLTEYKFIDYFQNKVADKNNPIFNIFLNEMHNIALLSNLKVNPLEDLKALMNRFGYSSSYYTHIIDLTSFLNVLSDYELFLMLYFSSCRNVFTYDESFYIQSIENGNIIKILLEIKNRLK